MIYYENEDLNSYFIDNYDIKRKLFYSIIQFENENEINDIKN